MKKEIIFSRKRVLRRFKWGSSEKAEEAALPTLKQSLLVKEKSCWDAEWKVEELTKDRGVFIFKDQRELWVSA